MINAEYYNELLKEFYMIEESMWQDCVTCKLEFKSVAHEIRHAQLKEEINSLKDDFNHEGV